MWCRSRDGVQGPGSRGSSVGVVYCTILYWNVFVEIIKEPYISAAAPHGLLLPADLHTGRRVMKQASLEIHRFGEPRQFSPSLPPTLLSLLLSRVFFFFLSCLTFGLLNALQYIWFKHSIACVNSHLVRLLSRRHDWLLGSLQSVSASLSKPDLRNSVWYHLVCSESPEHTPLVSELTSQWED